MGVDALSYERVSNRKHAEKNGECTKIKCFRKIEKGPFAMSTQNKTEKFNFRRTDDVELFQQKLGMTLTRNVC